MFAQLPTPPLPHLSYTSYLTLLSYWRYFPLIFPIQLIIDYYPIGRTATPTSRFSLPGRPAWITMELVAPTTLLYTFLGVSSQHPSLPTTHYLLVGMFLLHYLNRALISPLRNPSMGGSHVVIVAAGIMFNIVNGAAIGGWLGGYGSAARVPAGQVKFGACLWALGLLGNVLHEEILRRVRTEEKKEGRCVVVHGREYRVPQGAGFAVCWYPHYLCEWLEWTGFMLAGGGGPNFWPAAQFLLNEIATMLPRALQGRRWYEKMFGNDVRGKHAVIPGVI